MKTKLKCALLLTCFIILFGCNTQPDTSSVGNYIPSADLEGVHKNRIPEKETPYTLCFENHDGSASLYIFSSPISFYDSKGALTLINNTLVKSSKSKYSYENKSSDIKTYFPKELGSGTPMLISDGKAQFSFYPESEGLSKALLTDYSDVTGVSHDAVTYQDNPQKIEISYVPTNAGIMANITLLEKPESNELSFVLSMQDVSYSNIDNEYILFTNNDSKFVVNTSFLSSDNGKISFDNRVSVSDVDESDGSKLLYTIFLNEDFLSDPDTKYPLTITPSFETCRDTIQDMSVYSEKPETSAFLANYAVIGRQESFGIGEHYMKFKIKYVFRSYAQNVKSAVYSTVQLSGNTDSFSMELGRVKSVWRKESMNWNTRLDVSKTESVSEVGGAGRYGFDITRFVQVATSDDTWNTEAYGLLARNADESDSFRVLATSDNALYPPYTRIDFKQMPWAFESIEKMNPIE